MAIWQRLYNFVSGTRISSSQVDAELDQIINALNQHTNDIATGDTNTLNFTKQYGLGSTTQDITGQNLNSLDVTGFYWGSGMSNTPTGFTDGYVINIKKGTLYRKQFFIDMNSSKMFMRTQFGTWVPSTGYNSTVNGGWVEIFNTDMQAGFTNLTLTGGALVNNSRTPRYIKTGNLVSLEGEIQTIANNTIIATLPAGYRPQSYSLNFACPHASALATSTAIVSVNGSGQIQIIVSDTANSRPICFNNISFIAEQ